MVILHKQGCVDRMTRKVDIAHRNKAMVEDLRAGVTAEGLSKKYDLTPAYIRELLRKSGDDHLLDGAKPRNRRKKSSNVQMY